MTNQNKIVGFTGHTSTSSSMMQQQPTWLNLNLNKIRDLSLTWCLDRVNLPMALQKEMMMNYGYKPYTADMSPNLDAPLDLMEDPSLSFDQGPIVKSRRPPGVNTLTEWGTTVLPEGKWKDHTFAEVYVRDPKYVNFMAANTKLVSPWALSFHQYARLRLQLDREVKEKKMMMEQEMEHRARQVVAASSMMAARPKPREWEVISPTSSSGMGKQSQSSPGTLKRAMGDMEETAGMEPEIGQEIKDEKMLRLALLQREMDLIKKELGKE